MSLGKLGWEQIRTILMLCAWQSGGWLTAKFKRIWSNYHLMVKSGC